MAVMNETIVDSVEGLYRQGERRQQGWSHAWFHGKLAEFRTPLLPEAERQSLLPRNKPPCIFRGYKQTLYREHHPIRELLQL